MSQCIFPRCQDDFPYNDGDKVCTVLTDCYDTIVTVVSNEPVSPQPGT